MVASDKGYVSPARYLENESGAELRSEYWDGEVVAMAGGSPVHNRIVRNLIRRLGNLLEGSHCEPFTSETRVHIPRCNSCFYPDASVVCGTIETTDEATETILNPIAIFEVLSPATEAAERGRKFACYRSLSSLECYVLIEQETPAVDLFLRQPDGTWLLLAQTGIENVLPLTAIGITLTFSELYKGITWIEAEE